VAIGVTGVWQANVLAMLGLDVPATVVRYDPRWVLASLGVALATAIAGLFIASYGRIGFVRLLLAGALLGGGVAGANYALLLSLRVGGEITYPMALMPLAVALAMGVASALLRFLVGTRRLGSALMAAAGMGVAICAVHYVAEAAVAVRVGATDLGGADMGLDPMQIALPTMVLGGVLIVMMWFFTVGTATRRDLRAIFDPLDDVGQIEPWMIEEVTARVALNSHVRTAHHFGDRRRVRRTLASAGRRRRTARRRQESHPSGESCRSGVGRSSARRPAPGPTIAAPPRSGQRTPATTTCRRPSVAPVSPAPITAATAVPSANEPDVARQYIAPLPRRNARR
jgi:NO-binding membrane sensor protein with MHYT domain